MQQINLIHLGLGNVGKTLQEMIYKNADHIAKKQGLEIKPCGFFTSKSGYFYPLGFPFSTAKSYENERFASTAKEAVDRVQLPFIVVDTTASDKTTPLLLHALRRGGDVVLSNKKPLSGPQKNFDTLHSIGTNKILYETTVGAALPVINTLRDLLLTGDEVLEINGCFSGTLGFICSAMEDGVPYSQAVRKAKALGFTEPDPRDDLSGLDVTRKALILARVLGYKLELEDIKRIPFYPVALSDCNVEEFLNKILNYDSEFGNKFLDAKKNNKTLRYVAHICANKIEVTLTEVSKNSQLGRLKGSDNIVIFKTKRYNKQPLVIQGPGAGAEVTASGVLADFLKVGK